MRTGKPVSAWAIVAALCVVGVSGVLDAQTANKNSESFTDDFMIERCTFSSVGKNPFFILQPGYRQVYRGEEDGEAVELRITVLNKTKGFGSITTRVVEERETHDGQLVEVSFNYFAICEENGGVFYFGERTDNYEGGVIVNHDGSWLHGVDGARAGLIMPGLVLLGSRYYQEVAPGVALDRAEILATHEEVSTPAGVFQDCLLTEESTPLEPKALEYKLYAPGVGLVQDGPLQLVSIAFVRLR